MPAQGSSSATTSSKIGGPTCTRALIAPIRSSRPPDVSPTTLDTTIHSSFTRPELLSGRGVVRCGDAVATYDEIATAARGFAAWLVSEGVMRSDRVALWLPNGIAWVVAHVGVAAAGAVCVPVSTKLTTHEATYILRHADLAAVVTTDEFLGRHYAEEARSILEAGGVPTP